MPTILRDRLLIGVVAALVAATLFGAVLGDAVALEVREMALTHAGFGAWFIVAVGLIPVICFHIQSGHDSRKIDPGLSRPLSRARSVLIYWTGFSGLPAILARAAAAVLPTAGALDRAGVAAWASSLDLEAGPERTPDRIDLLRHMNERIDRGHGDEVIGTVRA